MPETIPAVLTEEVVIDAAVAPLPEQQAASGGDGPRRVVQARLVVDPSKEYVAASMNGALLGFARSLPAYIDDITRDFGPDLYERMANDPHIAGETNTYKLAVLANGVRLLPAVEANEEDPAQQARHEIAEEVRQFCQTNLDELDNPLQPFLRDMLGAFGAGNRVAEVVYRKDGARLMLHRLKPKPRASVAFVADAQNNVLGVLGALAGRTDVPRLVGAGPITSLSQVPNLLPRSKFALLTWNPTDGDPRGTSSYRPAYNPWWQKRQTEIELCRYIAQFAGSALFATTPEGAEPQPMTNGDGSFVLDTDGEPRLVHPQVALQSVLDAYRNGAAVVAPFGTELKNITAVGAGIPFFDELERCDKQISKALLGQSLATNEGQHMARAAAGNSKDVLDLLVAYGENAVAGMLYGVLRELVRLNFGNQYAREFTPKISMSAVEEADFSELATAFAGIGYQLDRTQMPEADAKLGFKPVEREETEPVALAPGNLSANNPGGSPYDDPTDPKAKKEKPGRVLE